VSGMAREPAVRWDTAPVRDALRKKAARQVEKFINRLLPGWKKHGSGDSAASGPDTLSQGKKPAELIPALLEGLFRKKPAPAPDTTKP
ncbi:MAG: hypothetical protein U9N45_08035, partial [Gemmatimonadota bacterium]|nr:hypothetical protein [Gemmatimonadota bacterium]